MGDPYVWGGETPKTGFDCSGLVKWCYGQHGIELPKWARAQWDKGVEDPIAVPGDLVFFVDTYDVYAVHGWFKPPKISHVGIYLGDNRFLNANSEAGVTINSLADPYWKKHLKDFRRVLT